MAASSSPADSTQQRFHQRQHQDAAEHLPFRLFGTTISTACSADSDSDRDSSTKSQAEEQPTTESMENSNDLEGESSDNYPPHHHQTKLSCRKRRSCERTPVKKPDKLIPCPRCDSLDTKFCYYNNYNVNQPRHFCKNCQRYWTAGGTLRNVPVGAGRRKSKHNNNNHNHNTTTNNTSSNNITNLALGATSSPSTIHGSHQCFSPVISFGLEKAQNTTTAGDHNHHHLGSSASRITEVLLGKAMKQSEINELKGKEEVSSSSNEWWINIMKAAAASKSSSGACPSSSSWPFQRRRDDPYPQQQQQPHHQPIHYQFFKIHHQSSPSSTAAVHAANSSSVLTSSANLYLSSSDNCPISVFPDKKPEEASSLASCFESFHEHSNPSFPR